MSFYFFRKRRNDLFLGILCVFLVGCGIAVYMRIEREDEERILEAHTLAERFRDYSKTFAVNQMMTNSPTNILMTSVKTNALQFCHNGAENVALAADSATSGGDEAEMDYATKILVYDRMGQIVDLHNKYFKLAREKFLKSDPTFYLTDFIKFEKDLLGLDFSRCPNDFRVAALDYHHIIRELRATEHAFLIAQREALSNDVIVEKHDAYIRAFAAYRDAVDKMCVLAKKHASDVASRDILMQY